MPIIDDSEFISNIKHKLEGDFLNGRGQFGQTAKGAIGAGVSKLWTTFPSRPHRVFARPAGASTIELPPIGKYDKNKCEQGHTIYIKNDTTLTDPKTPVVPSISVVNDGGSVPDSSFGSWTSPATSVTLAPGEAAFFTAESFDSAGPSSLDEWIVIGPIGSGPTIKDATFLGSLQDAYDNSTGEVSHEIILNDTNFGVQIQDRLAAPLGTDLFGVLDSTGGAGGGQIQFAIRDGFIHGFGATTTSTGTNSVALGETAEATGSDAFALGNTAKANSAGAYVLGRSSTASADDTYIFGNSATASAAEAFAMGSSSDASGMNAYAIGGAAKATADNAYAIGNEAKASAVGAHTHSDGSVTGVDNSVVQRLLQVFENGKLLARPTAGAIVLPSDTTGAGTSDTDANLATRLFKEETTAGVRSKAVSIYSMPESSGCILDIQVMAVRKGASQETNYYHQKLTLYRTGAAAATIGTPIPSGSSEAVSLGGISCATIVSDAGTGSITLTVDQDGAGSTDGTGNWIWMIRCDYTIFTE